MKGANRLVAVVLGALATGTAARAMAQQSSASDQDQQQVEQIQARLHKDADLQDNRIGVTVDHGVATLTGKVDTPMEKSDAARLALITGVVGVDNRLEVGSTGVEQAVSDSAVTAKIKGRLTEQGLAEFSDVSVTTNNGVVVLTGSVPNADAATQVLNIVRRSHGVSRIENHLEIAPPKQR